MAADYMLDNEDDDGDGDTKGEGGEKQQHLPANSLEWLIMAKSNLVQMQCPLVELQNIP